MRIVQGGKVVDETGVPFALALSQLAIHNRQGRTIGALEVSVQDVIGFVRDTGSGRVHTSLPAEQRVRPCLL